MTKQGEWEQMFKEGVVLNVDHLFVVALGLCCCARASSSFKEQGLLFLAVLGFLTAVAFLVLEHRLEAYRLQ